MARRSNSQVFHSARRLWTNTSGQIAVTFAITAMILITLIGGGLDFSRAMIVRQELSNAASLACQYSSRPTVAEIVYSSGTGSKDYVTAVNSYASNSLASQGFRLSQTVASPFSFVSGGASTVTLKSSVPTNFLSIISISRLPIGVTIRCVAGKTQAPEVKSPTVFTEGFENAACSGTCWGGFTPSGKINAFSSTPTNTPTSKVGYIGSTNTQWSVTGYCVEIDSAGIIMPTVAQGIRSAELDCDNGKGTAGNSAISNKSFLDVGTYELRYNYSGRLKYPAYTPAYICGTTAADVSWANETNYTNGTALRTNQINVYLDQDTTGAPPSHTTLDGTQTLAGSNLIDVCVYSSTWIERSVKINVTTAGYYWTTFAADGANDSYGGQLDNVRFCRVACSGAPNDNFPANWTGGAPLFVDTFDTPTYTADSNPSHYIAKGGNPYLSQGTSGTSSYGWPGSGASGWAAAPYNQVTYALNGAFQGAQYVALDGWNGSNGGANTNRLISRPFLLDPGYYKVSYGYISMVTFASAGGPYCYSSPPAGFSLGAPTSSTGQIRYYNTLSTTTDTNIVGVFMSHSQLTSTPNVNPTLLAATNYTNPDGTVTAMPKAPPDAMSTTNYDPTQVNPLIDICAYADTWQARSANVTIAKPGIYWLTFSAQMGAADGNGGGIDNVMLTPLNSPYGVAPGASVAIPTPGVGVGSTLYYSGYSITADPLTP